jgi:hypothetical protein
MKMKEIDIRAFEGLMRDYNCKWLNTGRDGADWKAKIFERESDRKQVAIYDRAKGFQIRLESFDKTFPGVKHKHPCPKGSNFDHSLSKFKGEKGICVIADDLAAVIAVLDEYYGALEGKSFSIGELAEQFDSAVSKSFFGNSSRRKARLLHAPKKPKRKTVTVTVYDRNPDVVAERLFLASGVCDDCKNAAPFMRARNGEPYLEVHHIDPLSANGDDSVDNTVALCANCHRERHYG